MYFLLHVDVYLWVSDNPYRKKGMNHTMNHNPILSVREQRRAKYISEYFSVSKHLFLLQDHQTVPFHQSTKCTNYRISNETCFFLIQSVVFKKYEI